MKYNQLGKSSLQISEVGFGCMSLGADDQANAVLIQEAISNGINFFDTADLYDHGNNEISLGKAIATAKREALVIATKVGNQWKADGSGWDWNPSKKYILASVEDSLRRLNTDYIDLYQLHGGTIQDPVDETIEAFEILVQQGKIRYYGISSIRPEVIREYVRKSNIVSVMMQYSLLDRRPEETSFPLLMENNIGVLARGTVAKGLLAGKAAAPYLNYSAKEVAQAAAGISTLSGENRPASQTALRYVLQQPAVTSAILGIRTAAHLSDAVAASAALPLMAAEVAQLNHILPVNKYEQFR
ncbi:Predicted oxidoreductase [Chitinophaga jiangningensis]|uniref:Predicted oxidoreductase n=1 Tax=Chitinophaga jiangningensis TaxID=1419482 RepID=A0A1M7FAB8_9BACT|nr:aldo/keto reductase [Chitinophaga jiangningensis]SHM00698.1 Predicted oxidoreductase [Chitinophaga jiangningensis]